MSNQEIIGKKWKNLSNRSNSLISGSVVSSAGFRRPGCPFNYSQISCHLISVATIISFTLERPGNVRITIWDITGKMVYEVAEGFYEAESHSETWNASEFASGIYFCRVELEEQAAMQKMILVQ